MSSDVKRYDFLHLPEPHAEQRRDGYWVEYTDYTAAIAERDALRRKDEGLQNLDTANPPAVS